MTRKTYTPNPDVFKSYYVNQAQNGGNLPAFRGARVQRGYGIGSFIRGLFRSAVPMFKAGAKAVGKKALSTGLNIANDVIEGQDFKSSARNLAIEAKNELSNMAKKSVKNALGQTGKGIKRPATQNSTSQPQTKKRKTSKSKPSKARAKTKTKQVTYNDIFD